MQDNRWPLTQDLVLVGGGHTHALLLRRWGMMPLPGVRVTVINPGPTAPYSGMLPGFVAGHYGRYDLDIDLVRLARFAGARVIVGAAEAIDLTARSVSVPGRPVIGYDVLSVDVGITSAMPELPGFAAYGVPAKPLGPFAARWDAYRQEAVAPRVVVIGGGVAGAELAMAMAHALRGRAAEVVLLDRGRVLDGFNAVARRELLAAMGELGIVVIEDAAVAQVAADHVMLSDGRRIAAGFVTGAAGARPHRWLEGTGLALEAGFIAVDGTLRASDPAVFAVGDCAHMVETPRPKAGVYAVRQAPVLFDNLRAVLSGGALRPFVPQRDYLKLISLGGQSALAEKWGTARRGRLLWRWKDRIDRSFMARFRDLPVMALPEVPGTAALGLRAALGDAPLCGGCGAKVGRGALQGALAGLPVSTRADVTMLPGDDAALLGTGAVRQVITTDHLRAVTADPALMARIAAVHALGDIWAMGAAPQAAVASVILPRMSPDLQARTLAEMMSVAAEVMAAAGAVIAGGHTSMGDELTVGFTVTGLCEAAPITLAGAQPGDALILTKPLGSGVILAAEMAGRAQGAEVVACHAAMVVPQGSAAQILRGAHAMTDVTGFGLAGHLAGLCAASGVAARIDLAALPLMAGAEALAASGVRSTLWAANRGGAGEVRGAVGARADLVFDPQTGGGLLAAVAAGAAPALLAALRAAGHDAALIGEVWAGPPVITLSS